MIAVGEADHDDADVECLAAGALLGLHLVLEVEACQAVQRAMLARYLHTAIAGKGLDEAVEQPFGKAVAIGLQLVDIAFRERRDVADARRLLLRSSGPCQRERQHHEHRNEGCTDGAHFPFRVAAGMVEGANAADTMWALSLPRPGVNNKATHGPPLSRSRRSSSMARVAVLDQAECALRGADGGAGAVADDAVEPSGIESPGREQALQLLALGPVERRVVRRPGRSQRRAASDSVGEVADGERVRRGLVVFEKHPEVVRDQERRPSRARRKDELQRQPGRRIAAGCDRLDPRGLPLGKRPDCDRAPTRQSRNPAAGRPRSPTGCQRPSRRPASSWRSKPGRRPRSPRCRAGHPCRNPRRARCRSRE